MGPTSGFPTATDLARQVRTGERSPVDIVETHLERIARHDDDLGAFITVTDTRAREVAAIQAERLPDGTDQWPLAGVPIGVKDVIDVEGVATSHGVSLLADNVADADDPAIDRLHTAGAVTLGKTNTPPFARSALTESDIAGPCATPFDPAANAGGSSGGSAAAVAAGFVAIGYGTDGGGSIRIPASLCGVVGFKPTFGRIPWTARPDAFAHARGNHAGVLTRSVGDAALALDVLAGPAETDPFSLPPPGEQYRSAIEDPPDGLRIAYSPHLGVFPVANAVEAVVDEAVTALADTIGATIERADPAFDMTLSELTAPKYQRWGPVHTAVLVDRIEQAHGINLTEHPEVVGEAFVTAAETGRSIDAVSYQQVNVPHTAIYDAVQSLLDEYDLLATPTLAVDHVAHGSEGPTHIDGDEIDPDTDWFLTFPFNFGGPPAISIPAGTTAAGYPVGLQLVGARLDDATVLQAAAALEEARPWDHLHGTALDGD